MHPSGAFPPREGPFFVEAGVRYPCGVTNVAHSSFRQTHDMRHESDTLRAGDRAPAFSLPTQKGTVRTLADLLAAGPLLLAFHRGTW
jgi:hypothetical protein